MRSNVPRRGVSTYLTGKKSVRYQAFCVRTDQAFGPYYQHHQGTAFGFYVEGFGAVAEGEAELQAEPGKTPAVTEGSHDVIKLVAEPTIQPALLLTAA